MKHLAAKLIKPNDRLSSFERLEIYNRCRVLDCLYDDYPGFLAILGNRQFLKLATVYLERYPSQSFTLRNLGSRLEQFLLEKPQWTSLLKLHHAVDDFLIAVRKRETDIFRSEASNTVDGAPEAPAGRRRVRLPGLEKVYLAIHRHGNVLYYKRLEAAAFALLTALRRGDSLEEACQAAIDTGPNSDTGWPEKDSRVVCELVISRLASSGTLAIKGALNIMGKKMPYGSF